MDYGQQAAEWQQGDILQTELKHQINVLQGFSKAVEELNYSRGAQHTARGLHAAHGKPGYGPPLPAQNVLILAQKWLSCVGGWGGDGQAQRAEA